MSSDLPAPLPIPPPSPTTHESSNTQRHPAINSIFPPPPAHASPKQWTPADLSTYLSTALLRSQSGETLPLSDRVVIDISAYVKYKGISGRTFLRLDDAELEE